ncbi:MAG TPA: hypothetical protein VFQ61_10715 [Polyangiaceae bacterium]|nr:hypothetical protein [Polyangiaceae bacterium]
MRQVDPLLRWCENPFFLLGLMPTASERDIEREGRKLLGQLELGLRSARWARTPLGEVERTPDSIRSAIAELRDPQKRRVHAIWAALPIHSPGVWGPTDSEGHAPPTGVTEEPFLEAMSAAGWPGL